jgi:TonB family protein
MRTVFFALTICLSMVVSIAFCRTTEVVPAPKPNQPPPQSNNGGDIDDRIPDPSFLSNSEVPPKVIQDVDPVWPDSAKNVGISGKVSVQFYVDETGTVQRALIVKSKPKGWGFEESALKAIYQHKFIPAKEHDVPTGVWMLEVFTFKVK